MTFRLCLHSQAIPDSYLLPVALEPEGAVFLKRKWSDPYQPNETRRRLTELVLSNTLELAMSGTSGGE